MQNSIKVKSDFIQNPNKVFRNIPIKLPLLDAFIEKFGMLDLKHTAIIAQQHLEASSVPLFVALNRLNVKFENMFVIGKIYSTNPHVVEKIKKLNIFVYDNHDFSQAQALNTDYQETITKQTNKFIKKVLAKIERARTIKKIIALDDGGILIQEIIRHGTSKKIAAIEQTRSGARKIATLSEIHFPIINVAESHAKLAYESPYIAKAIVNDLNRRLVGRINHQLTNKNILIIGYGSIGQRVADELKAHSANVTIFDHDSKKMMLAKKNGFLTEDINKSMARSDIILTCIGKQWLENNMINNIGNDTILASTSSYNIDLLALPIQSKTNISKNRNCYLTEAFFTAHATYKADLKTNKSCYILNAGFPLPFDGSLDDVPLDKIQLTQALMLAGVYQTSICEEKNIQLLDKNFQHFIVENFLKLADH